MIQVMIVWWTDVADPAKDIMDCCGSHFHSELFFVKLSPRSCCHMSEQWDRLHKHCWRRLMTRSTVDWFFIYFVDCIASSKCWAFYSWSIKTFSDMVPRLHPTSRCCNVSVAVRLVSSGKQITAGWRKRHYYQYSSDCRHRHQDSKLKLCPPKTGNTDLITTD